MLLQILVSERKREREEREREGKNKLFQNELIIIREGLGIYVVF